MNPAEKIFFELPDNLKQFVASDTPADKKLLVARGAVPLMPKDLATVLFVLIYDDDERISNEALSSLKDLPEKIMSDILSDRSTRPEVLDYVARNFDNDKYTELVLLNSSAEDSTVAFIAGSSNSQRNLDIITSNKSRMLRTPDILEALSNNHHVRRSSLDEVLSFMNIHLNKDHFRTKQQTEEIVEDPVEEPIVEESFNEETDAGEEYPYDSFFDSTEISDEFIDEYHEEQSEELRESLYARIQTLTMAEKLKIAMLGNMEARRILIKDNNRVIADAVLKNPRITDMEIVLICQSKVVSDDILRQISENRKWMRLYQVKLSLINNPKTPVHISVNLLRHLRDFDLRTVMVNKNLPGAVTNAARKIYGGKR